MSTTFKQVKIADLLLTKEHGVQRAEGIQIKRAEKIASQFDLSKVGVITVSEREDGSLFCCDGAHRTYAANVVGVDTLPALVHHGLTKAEEAALFYSLNDFKQPSAVSRFLASVTMGDPTDTAIMEIVEGHGWKISSNASSEDISCVEALQRIYRTAGGVLPVAERGTVLDWTLDIVTSAWGHDREAANSHVLIGVAQLIGRYGPDIDSKKIVSELSQTRPKAIVGHAKVLREAMGGTVPAHVAKVLVGMHNKKRRTNLLPEWVWTR